MNSTYSIRRRLMLLLAVGFSVLIVGTGIYLVGIVNDRVTEEWDAALLAKARTLVLLTEDDGETIEVEYIAKHWPEFERSEQPDYFQFWLLEDKGTLRRLPPEREWTLPHSKSPSKEPLIRDVRLPDGRAGRMVELAFVPEAEDGVRMTTTNPLRPDQRMLRPTHR